MNLFNKKEKRVPSKNNYHNNGSNVYELHNLVKTQRDQMSARNLKQIIVGLNRDGYSSHEIKKLTNTIISQLERIEVLKKEGAL